MLAIGLGVTNCHKKKQTPVLSSKYSPVAEYGETFSSNDFDLIVHLSMCTLCILKGFLFCKSRTKGIFCFCGTSVVF